MSLKGRARETLNILEAGGFASPDGTWVDLHSELRAAGGQKCSKACWQQRLSLALPCCSRSASLFFDSESLLRESVMKLVATPPGWMTLTLIEDPSSSASSTSVKPRTANLLMQ